jgi:ectoine hydroxylase-related dioxygenase (phytanoyl-CoA dioxygenase family)
MSLSVKSPGQIQIRAANTLSEELAKILERDGCVVLKDFVSNTQVESLVSDLQPFIEASAPRGNEFSGMKTMRTGALMARSPHCRELAIDPRILGLVETFLGPYANTFQLHVTQVIRVLPGEKVQMPHRDRWAWSQLQAPSDLEPPVNTVVARLMTELNIMLALTDFTKENGATRIAPGSNQLPDDAKLPEGAFVSAEMTSGSLLVFTGSALHGAGANKSERDRIGLNIAYTLGWLRQEDNQYLSCPPEIAKDLDPKLQALLGYAVGGPSMGYFTPPLPAGEDLSSPQRALQLPAKPVRLDADGRPEFVED